MEGGRRFEGGRGQYARRYGTRGGDVVAAKSARAEHYRRDVRPFETPLTHTQMRWSRSSVHAFVSAPGHCLYKIQLLSASIAVERHVIGTPTRVGLDGGWVTILLQDLRMPARAVGSLGVDSHLSLVWHVCAAATGAAPGWRPHQAPADGRSDPSVCILYSCSSAACSLRGKERSRRRIEQRHEEYPIEDADPPRTYVTSRPQYHSGRRRNMGRPPPPEFDPIPPLLAAPAWSRISCMFVATSACPRVDRRIPLRSNIAVQL